MHTTRQGSPTHTAALTAPEAAWPSLLSPGQLDHFKPGLAARINSSLLRLAADYG
ncbi:MAG: hypothetical protein IBX40_11545 [Methanosarcinales archaeon]|nr:hypothetical protein [Methanosarcinales archaeon]